MNPLIFSLTVSILLLDRPYFPFIQFPWGVHASHRSKCSAEIFEACQNRWRTPWGYIAEGTTFSMDTHPFSTALISFMGKGHKKCLCGGGLEVVPRDFPNRLKELLIVFWQERRKGRCEEKHLNLRARTHIPVGRTFARPLTMSNATMKWVSKSGNLRFHQSLMTVTTSYDHPMPLSSHIL